MQLRRFAIAALSFAAALAMSPAIAGQRDCPDASKRCPARCCVCCLKNGDRPAWLALLAPKTATSEPLDDARHPHHSLSIRTVSQHPVLWIYVPESSAVSYTLWLQDADRNLVYERRFEPEELGQARIEKLDFARLDGIPALGLGDRYRWFFELNCHDDDRSGDDTIGGQIERIAPPDGRLDDLRRFSPRNLVNAYGRRGLDFDQLATIAQLRREEPGDRDIAELWERLLRDAGLLDYADVEFSDWEFR